MTVTVADVQRADRTADGMGSHSSRTEMWAVLITKARVSFTNDGWVDVWIEGEEKGDEQVERWWYLHQLDKPTPL